MKIGSIVICLGLFSASIQAQNTAQVNLSGLSFQVFPATQNHPTAGPITAFFTTYSGRTNSFPLADVKSNQYLFSSEVRPRPGNPGVYETDYATYSALSGTFIQYGSIAITLSTADTDSNGVPDFLQKERSAEVDFTGISTSFFPAILSTAIAGHFSRPAGALVGQFSSRSAASGLVLSGNWWTLAASGTLTYSRSGNTAQLKLTGSDGATVRTVTAATSFIVAGSEQLIFNPLALVREDQTVRSTLGPVSLARFGNKYRGAVLAVDGLLDTSWPDFIQWLMEITDANDGDTNGIPDLTDILRPKPPRLVTPQIVNHAIQFQFATGVGPTYRVMESSDFSAWRTALSIVGDGKLTTVTLGTADPKSFFRVVSP